MKRLSETVNRGDVKRSKKASHLSDDTAAILFQRDEVFRQVRIQRTSSVCGIGEEDSLGVILRTGSAIRIQHSGIDRSYNKGVRFE
jgi:hypothetical protein